MLQWINFYIFYTFCTGADACVGYIPRCAIELPCQLAYAFVTLIDIIVINNIIIHYDIILINYGTVTVAKFSAGYFAKIRPQLFDPGKDKM